MSSPHPLIHKSNNPLIRSLALAAPGFLLRKESYVCRVNPYLQISGGQSKPCV